MLDITAKKIYTVSQLTFQIKKIMENNFPIIWIEGEISNLKKPFSGHYYFTIKDSKAQISAVMFKGQAARLKYIPKDGMLIIGLGRINVYEPYGTYQIVLERLEPKGDGAFQIAFEQLKIKLAKEGLFETKYKKKLPFIPSYISIITSPTGAVIHDIINITTRRFPCRIEIFPVKVQGETSINEIVEALDYINTQQKADVIIIARGGGSLEDMQAFNSEKLARKIFASSIPVISAIGHETDYTISDFTSDLRAPTPSAAAELVVPVYIEQYEKLLNIYKTLINTMFSYFNNKKIALKYISNNLISPKKRIESKRIKIDHLYNSLLKSINNILKLKRNIVIMKEQKIKTFYLDKKINHYKKDLNYKQNILFSLIQKKINNKKLKLNEVAGKIDALSPLNVLNRGYSITRTIPDKQIIYNSNQCFISQHLEILLGKGKIECIVERVEHGEKNI